MRFKCTQTIWVIQEKDSCPKAAEKNKKRIKRKEEKKAIVVALLGKYFYGKKAVHGA